MKNFLYSLFMGLFGIAGLTSIAFLLMYAAQSIQQAHLYSDLAAVRKQDTQQEIASQSSVQPTSRNLYLENADMIGWIQIEGTNIDYPVMQTPADPNYYLKHDFERNYTDYGCPFMQADCDALCPSDNLIIYGHNMKTGLMFASLMNYKQQYYYDIHPYFYLYTPSQTYKVNLFAGCIVEHDADVYSLTLSDSYIQECIQNSTFKSSYGAPTGNILTLSTCDYDFDNARYVVMGELVPVKNPAESAE